MVFKLKHKTLGLLILGFINLHAIEQNAAIVEAEQILQPELAALEKMAAVTEQLPEHKPNLLAKPAEVSSAASISDDMQSNKALFIFLDDSEDNINNNYAISAAVADVLRSNAGPMVVSASLLVNIRDAGLFDEKVCQELILHPKDRSLSRKRVLFIKNFAQEIADRWIIKEISPELYLLLPIYYTSTVTPESINLVTTGPITATEQQLGLKVNHMPTRTLADIVRPTPKPTQAPYFMQAVWQANQSKLFVTNQEYARENSANMPNWSFYIAGHGGFKTTIVGLALVQFKTWLDFLENKINTRLLYYFSCFAAGLNNQLIYTDVKTGIGNTYSYAIITQALTDTMIFIAFAGKYGGNWCDLGQIFSFRLFAGEVTSEVIDYGFAARMMETDREIASSVPQIKFPGLAWFSVIDEHKVVSIGDIMAKTRTAPLNITTFFKREKGEAVRPEGLLLYTQDVPFQLIINLYNSPAIVSMVPGAAKHHLRSIYSNELDSAQLVNLFLQIDGRYGPRKLFLIDEIRVHDDADASEQAITNVIIELKDDQQRIYFIWETELRVASGKISYENQSHPATAAEKAEYEQLLVEFNKFPAVADVTPAAVPTPVDEPSIDPVAIAAITTDLQAQANAIFAEKITAELALKELENLLTRMPNHSLVRIAALNGIATVGQGPAVFEKDWKTMLKKLSTFNSAGDAMRKIIMIDELKIFPLAAVESKIIYDHLVVDLSDDQDSYNTAVFFRDQTRREKLSSFTNGASNPVAQDYQPKYTALAQYFAKHQHLPIMTAEIDTRSVHEMLTPASVADLNAVLEKQVAKKQAV